MQEGKVLGYRQINQDLLRGIFENPVRYWAMVFFLGIIVLGAMSAGGYMINRGIGVTGVESSGNVGLLHHQLRLLDRHQPRRGYAVGHPASVQG